MDTHSAGSALVHAMSPMCESSTVTVLRHFTSASLSHKLAKRQQQASCQQQAKGEGEGEGEGSGEGEQQQRRRQLLLPGERYSPCSVDGMVNANQPDWHFAVPNATGLSHAIINERWAGAAPEPLQDTTITLRDGNNQLASWHIGSFPKTQGRAWAEQQRQGLEWRSLEQLAEQRTKLERFLDWRYPPSQPPGLHDDPPLLPVEPRLREVHLHLHQLLAWCTMRRPEDRPEMYDAFLVVRGLRERVRVVRRAQRATEAQRAAEV